MIIESKIKYSVFKLALEITLKGIEKNPQRCARNVIELIKNSYPGILNAEQESELYSLVTKSAINEDISCIRENILNLINK